MKSMWAMVTFKTKYLSNTQLHTICIKKNLIRTKVTKVYIFLNTKLKVPYHNYKHTLIKTALCTKVSNSTKSLK